MKENHLVQENLLPTPGELDKQYPITAAGALAVRASRNEIASILDGTDERLLVIVGPCSMDDSLLPNNKPSVIEYAERLSIFAREPIIEDHAKVVMRAPISKPRTNLGWAGLAQTNPERAYALLTDIANLQVPVAIETMTTENVDYFHSRLAMGWVGARNVEDTTIRHVASDIDMPILFKNAANGSIVPATNAIETAQQSHIVHRMREDGRLVLKQSMGNPHTGLIYRGGADTSPEQFAQQFVRLNKLEHPLVVDCSHGNSAAFGEGKKTPEAQLACITALQRLAVAGHVKIKGVMIESYLLAGSDTSGNTPGMSRTDPCIDFERSAAAIRRLAKAQKQISQNKV